MSESPTITHPPWRGRQLAVVMTGTAALAVLDAETAKGRTVAEVLAWALIEADRRRVG